MNANQETGHLWYHRGKPEYFAERFGTEPPTDPKKAISWRRAVQNHRSGIDDFFKTMTIGRDGNPPQLPPDWEVPSDPVERKRLLKVYRSLTEVHPESRQGYSSKAGQFLTWLAEKVSHAASTLKQALTSAINAKAARDGLEVNLSAIARQVGIPDHLLRHWMRGSLPSVANIPFVNALEDFLGLDRGNLANLCPLLLPLSSARATKYSTKLKALMKMGGCWLPKKDWAQRFLDHFDALVTHKIKDTKSWTVNSRGKCQGAIAMERTFSMTAGFCLAPPSEDPALTGLKSTDPALTSLKTDPEAWGAHIFSYSEVLIGMLERTSYRAGFDPGAASTERKPVYNKTVANLIMQFCMLLRPETGFVTLHCAPPDPDLLPGSAPLLRTVALSLIDLVENTGSVWFQDDHGRTLAQLSRLAGDLSAHAAIADTAIRAALVPLPLCRCIEVKLDGFTPLPELVAEALEAHPITATLATVGCVQPGNAMSWLSEYSQVYPNQPLFLVLHDCDAHLRARKQLGVSIEQDIVLLQAIGKATASSPLVRMICTVTEPLASMELGALLQRLGFSERRYRDPLEVHQERCAATLEEISRWVADNNPDGQFVDSRDMTPGLAWVLSHKSPVACMMEIAKKMVEHVELLQRSDASPEIVALGYRNYMIVRLMLEIPFRAEQFLDLRYSVHQNTCTLRDDGRSWTSDLYMRPGDSRLYVRQAIVQFKNRTSKGCHYWDDPLTESTARIVLTYIRDHRPHLRDPESDFLILGGKCGRHAKCEGGIKHLVTVFLDSFIPGGGFGLHGFRKIVVTDILHDDIRDEEKAAWQINDTVEQVWLAYGKPKHSVITADYINRVQRISENLDAAGMLRLLARQMSAEGKQTEIPPDVVRLLQRAVELKLPLETTLDALT